MCWPCERCWPWALFGVLALLLILASVPLAQATPTPTDGSQSASTTPLQAAAAGPSVLHVVKDGETLWTIAHAYGVSVDAIVDANTFDKRKLRQLSKGATLRIPGATQLVDVQASKALAEKKQALPSLRDGAYHHMRSGESLWTVARTYDVPIETLMARNQLTDDDLPGLRIGQSIIVPGVKEAQIKHEEPKAKHKGFVRQLEKGETVWDIAHAYRVGVGEIMAANRLSAEEVSNLRDGTRLFIPGVEDDGSGHVRRRASARERRAQNAARRLGLGTIKAAGMLLQGRVDKRWLRAASKLGRFPGTLKWPVAHGWLVRGYGSGQGGYHKAMDIMGKIGWNVRAAAPGIVGYAGDQVPGFGNMIMVVHPGGWVTLYAHNSVNFVVAGETVARGGVLAEVGSTGRSMGPHVHFELIEKNSNCDPAPLFRPGVRHRNGKLARLEYATWRQPDRRPSEVRCAKRQKHPFAQSVMSENPEQDATPEAEQGPEMDAPAASDDDP